jgi:hypothetical protein
MRALMVFLAVSIALSSCASIEEEDGILVQDIEQDSSGSYNAPHSRAPFQHVRSFTVVASYAAIKGYGQDPKQAMMAITREIIASHGFCPNGYSIGDSSHIGTYTSVSWQIICNE